MRYLYISEIFLTPWSDYFLIRGLAWHSRYKRLRICRQPTSSNIRSKRPLPWYSYEGSLSMFFPGYESPVYRWEQKSWACFHGNISCFKWVWNKFQRWWARACHARACCRENVTYILFRMAKYSHQSQDQRINQTGFTCRFSRKGLCQPGRYWARWLPGNVMKITRSTRSKNLCKMI